MNDSFPGRCGWEGSQSLIGDFLMAKKEEKAEKEKAEKKASHKAEKHSKKAEKPKAEKEKAEKPAKKAEKEMAEKEAVLEENEDPLEEEGEKKPVRKKPKKPAKPRKVFAEKAPKDLVETIVKLANEGKTASEIGIILKDLHNVGSVHKLAGKKITQILKENSLEPKMPEDMMNLIRKSVTLREHLDRNKKDMSAKRGLMLTVSKIRALEKYYKKNGKLPLTWRYTPEKAALLAK